MRRDYGQVLFFNFSFSSGKRGEVKAGHQPIFNFIIATFIREGNLGGYLVYKHLHNFIYFYSRPGYPHFLYPFINECSNHSYTPFPVPVRELRCNKVLILFPFVNFVYFCVVPYPP